MDEEYSRRTHFMDKAALLKKKEEMRQKPKQDRIKLNNIKLKFRGGVKFSTDGYSP